jgi:hypothetical protein
MEKPESMSPVFFYSLFLLLPYSYSLIEAISVLYYYYFSFKIFFRFVNFSVSRVSTCLSPRATLALVGVALCKADLELAMKTFSKHAALGAPKVGYNGE